MKSTFISENVCKITEPIDATAKGKNLEYNSFFHIWQDQLLASTWPREISANDHSVQLLTFCLQSNEPTKILTV